MENLVVLAKVSKSCPLACVYCYEGEKCGLKMGETTLKRMTETICGREGAKTTEYVWHGSEPLTAGRDFYKKAKEFQKPFAEKQKIRNGMQSNGVLLTSELADLLVEEEIDVGFSLDGPSYIHNTTRPFHSGRGSYDEVMNAINLMQQRGKKPGVIAVLTKISLPYLDEIYDFFKANNLSFKINPIMDCGFAKDKQVLQLTVEERVYSICHLFDRWFDDLDKEKKADYDSMASLVRAMFKKGGSSCDMLKSCQESFMSIGVDGTIYPCSRFSGNAVMYGNIHDITNFEQVKKNSLRQKLLKKFDTISECQSCKYNFLCYSGCMHNAYVKGNIMEKDPNCKGNRQIYEHVAKKIIEQIEKDDAIKTKPQGE